MFPMGGIHTNEGWFSNEEIVFQNYDTLRLSIHKPSSNGMIEYNEELLWHSNGDMERYYTYSVFPYENIDNTPLLNLFGQKIFNNYLKKEMGL